MRARRAWTMFRRIGRWSRNVGPAEWRAFVRTLPIKQDTVFYESFSGSGMLCNPEAIFRGLLADPAQQHLTHVWALKEPRRHAAARRDFGGDRRVRFVKYRSARYFKELATARLLVNNATFPPEFSKREGQTYLNTWHGTPLKTMGYDEPEGVHTTRNVVRNFVMADYLLSQSRFMTEQMYESAYRLENIYQGAVIEEGYPRTDRQRLTSAGRAAVVGRLALRGLTMPMDGKVVLYAPTWKGASFYQPTNDVAELAERVTALSEALPDDHRVLLKVHQQVYDIARRDDRLAGVLVPNDVPTNEALGIADVLVSDYSSIFFDFLATGRPIVFFTPDVRDYSTYRGLYLPEDELPGPRATTVSELAELISAIGSGSERDPLRTHAEAYMEARSRFAPYDDGNVTERLLDIVVRGKPGGRVRETRRDGRPTLLIHLGGMRSNGITTSALNLLRSIDPERLDVTAIYNYKTDRDPFRNALAIPPHVRRFARIGSFRPSELHRRRRRALLQHGATLTPRDLDVMLALLKDEWYRCLGDSRFDYIVDFSGYSPLWSFLMAEVPAKSRSIWLHNDLKADQMREIDGRRPHENNLGAVFSSYRFYDHLVSVSEALSEINAARLSDYGGAEKFTWARNTIDAERILKAVHGIDSQVAQWPGDQVLEPAPGYVPVAEDLAELHGIPHLRHEIERRLAQRVHRRRPGVTTFVTAGRISPEKNHERLVRAFAKVHADDPETALVLIGSGPLEQRLRQVAAELAVGDSVVFTGLQANPWAIMAECDVFVLSSDYEGQPMVILEARLLGLPVVATAFGSVRGALSDGVGLVVDRDVDALAGGMRAALRGEVPNPPFDPVGYNKEALSDFYRAIGAD